MEFRTYRITQDDSGRRVDRVVRRFLPELSLSNVYKLLRKGLIRVDGNRVAPEFHVTEGNELKVAAILLASGRPDPESEKIPLYGFTPEIILETPDLLFILKPSGIPVHGDGGLDRLIPSSSRAMESLSFHTGPLHRLDADTSGLIAFSRSLSGAQWFSSAINEHRFEKYYLGIARGTLAREIEWRDSSDDGKDMITVAKPVAWSKTPGKEPLTLVRYRIITGRKHQIRIQTALHGYALIGDARYDKAPAGRSQPQKTYFLHAWQLVFPPDRLAGIPEKLVAPLPSLFRETALGLFGETALAHIENGELYWSEHDELQ